MDFRNGSGSAVRGVCSRKYGSCLPAISLTPSALALRLFPFPFFFAVRLTVISVHFQVSYLGPSFFSSLVNIIIFALSRCASSRFSSFLRPLSVLFPRSAVLLMATRSVQQDNVVVSMGGVGLLLPTAVRAVWLLSGPATVSRLRPLLQQPH